METEIIRMMNENRGMADKDKTMDSMGTINKDLIAEVASELGINDQGVINEVLEELLGTVKDSTELLEDVENSVSESLRIEDSISKITAKSGDLTPVMEYKTDRFQRVTIRPNENELLYTISEPELDENGKSKLAFVKNVFDKLIGMEDIVFMDEVEPKKAYLREKFEEIVGLYGLKFKDDMEKERIFYFIERDFLKYGKLDVMMNDKYIEDISCNGPNIPIYVYHRNYGSIKTNLSFSEVELNDYILRLAQLCGKHISILNPIMDASLPDGSRINITLGSEVTKKGSSFTIRKFKQVPMSPIELINFGTIDEKTLAYIWLLLDYGMSILISGGTASGKTTLLNAICMFIRPQLKIVSIEDTPEINLEHPNWLQSVSRRGFGQQHAGGGMSGISGLSGISPLKTRGDIDLYDMLVAALRQRPDYIVVGEVRGSEAFTMFQAIAIGHTCMGTIHARNMGELLGRVESVPMNVPRTLFSNVDLVVFIAQIRDEDGTIKRRVMDVVEVLGLEPETKGLITNPIVKWNGKDDAFDTLGRFMLLDKIADEFGISLEYLLKEHEKRSRFLNELKKNKVTNHIEITKRIVGYYNVVEIPKKVTIEEASSPT
ncbi:MAG TPA: hypothetical protein ENG12_02885 [Candidatus Altiarchaeales archaeon]|nr:hypothetical protein [Candidatus Altiarchaeales archaeon]